LQNDENGRAVIPGKRSATRNPLCFLDPRFRGNYGKLILPHLARGSLEKNYEGFSVVQHLTRKGDQFLQYELTKENEKCP